MNRRNLFKGLFGLAAAPVLAPLAGLLPETRITSKPRILEAPYGDPAASIGGDLQYNLATYYTYSFATNLKAQLPFQYKIKNISLPEVQSGKSISFYTYKLRDDDSMV